MTNAAKDKLTENLQADDYLLFIAIRSGAKSLEITVNESDENAQLPGIIRGYSKVL